MSRQLDSDDAYIDKVKKLIPAEVSAGFLAINASIPLDSSYNGFVAAFFFLLLMLCIAYLYMLEDVRNWLQIGFISLVAFPIWAVNIAIARVDWLQTKEFLPACLLIIVTLATPLAIRERNDG